MLGTLLIVFRETLEAALLIGIIAAATKTIPGRNRWIGAGIVAGVFGALLVAGLMDSIAQWADGIGQELFNAGVLGLAVVMLGWHNIWMAKHGAEMAADAKHVAHAVRDGRRELSAIAILIAVAVLREGSETALFLYGLASGGGLDLRHALTGGSLGLLAGAAAGAVIYWGLIRIPLKRVFDVIALLLLLLAAGMAGQMAKFLIQADLLPGIATPLWDTSAALPMASTLGSLLHLVAGYEAQPTAMQVIFYVATLTLIGLGMRWKRAPSLSAGLRTT